MSIQLNHTIVWCRDKRKSAGFLSDLFGLPEPTPFMHALVVKLDNDVLLDFIEKEGEVSSQHYAFLIGEQEFDEILSRIRNQELPYWADSDRAIPSQINHLFGGRGLYFEDPDGHFLEVMTKPFFDPPSEPSHPSV